MVYATPLTSSTPLLENKLKHSIKQANILHTMLTEHK